VCPTTTGNIILLFFPATSNSAGFFGQAGQCKAHRSGGQWRHCTGTHVSTRLVGYIAKQLSSWQAVNAFELVSATNASAINLTALLKALIPSCISTIRLRAFQQSGYRHFNNQLLPVPEVKGISTIRLRAFQQSGERHFNNQVKGISTISYCQCQR
jgi:hypothetical protein